MAGTITDCLVYAAAHNETTRQRVTQFLATKRGITL
jgi:hypothetical protein